MSELISAEIASPRSATTMSSQQMHPPPSIESNSKKMANNTANINNRERIYMSSDGGVSVYVRTHEPVSLDYQRHTAMRLRLKCRKPLATNNVKLLEQRQPANLFGYVTDKRRTPTRRQQPLKLTPQPEPQDREVTSPTNSNVQQHQVVKYDDRVLVKDTSSIFFGQYILSKDAFRPSTVRRTGTTQRTPHSYRHHRVVVVPHDTSPRTQHSQRRLDTTPLDDTTEATSSCFVTQTNSGIYDTNKLSCVSVDEDKFELNDNSVLLKAAAQEGDTNNNHTVKPLPLITNNKSTSEMVFNDANFEYATSQPSSVSRPNAPVVPRQQYLHSASTYSSHSNNRNAALDRLSNDVMALNEDEFVSFLRDYRVTGDLGSVSAARQQRQQSPFSTHTDNNVLLLRSPTKSTLQFRGVGSATQRSQLSRASTAHRHIISDDSDDNASMVLSRQPPIFLVKYLQNKTLQRAKTMYAASLAAAETNHNDDYESLDNKSEEFRLSRPAFFFSDTKSRDNRVKPTTNSNKMRRSHTSTLPAIVH